MAKTGAGPVADFISEYGEAFASAPLTDDEHDIVKRAVGKRRFHMKGCYYNSWRVVEADTSGEMLYVEGYRHSVPHALHAWISLRGKVVDLTVRPKDPSVLEIFPPAAAHLLASERYLGEFPVEEGYVGVAFKRGALRKMRHRYRNSLLDNWEEDWPVENGALEAYRVSAKTWTPK